MHGIIFFELKKFVDANLPEGTWEKLLAGANLSGRFYTPLLAYPDEEVAALVAEASQLIGVNAQDLLASFGEFIAPDLLQMYRHLFQPGWRTLDVIENTEAVIHAVVRSRTPGAQPPVLRTKRISPSEVELRYNSPRKMCSVAKGIMKGVAAHFGEPLASQELSCMNKGAAECVFRLRIG